MDNPVSIDDVESVFGPLDDAQTRASQVWVDVAWGKLKRKVPTLVAQIQSEKADMVLVKQAVVSAVVRVLNNPKGVRSGGLDDGQFTIDVEQSSGRLYIHDDDVADLKPTWAIPGVYSLPMGVPYWE
ncbi:Uncharacterised protein [Brevibacterium casei]|uniref:Phage protein Gp19/Gp15/Gp42 n=1 Tax=Brevibacterium casei TaxID=33889 RepID=A0A449D7T6_9MICO|nr:hypothetical protein [Brevibacterium casei]VEW13556.1 Uncharacterised protein [Brevibacterium casei]